MQQRRAFLQTLVHLPQATLVIMLHPILQRCFAVLIGITFCGLTFPITESSAEAPANSRPGVGYVGTEACISCHKEQYQSYLETKHSISMVKVDPDQEKLPAKFYHKTSMTDYEVFRKGDQMIHREIIRGVDGQELVRNEHPVLYTIGSGTHGKGYIFKDGDFLGQSPVSWYQSSETWDVSPGYDVPLQPGFSRILNSECFFCHVGGMDRKAGNPNVFDIKEVASVATGPVKHMSRTTNCQTQNPMRPAKSSIPRNLIGCFQRQFVSSVTCKPWAKHC